MLKGKTIILGISSSIAAYKACEVVSRLKKLGANVWVVMTQEAARLVSPLTFRTLSGNPVIQDLFSDDLSGIPVPHISITRSADLFLAAPCTANIMGKLANGIADDPLTTMALASGAVKMLAPAMNAGMWRNPIVQQNAARLKDAGFIFVGPEEGALACGDEDIGRMAEPDRIVEEVVKWLGIREDLKGKHFLITAGATREAIDPVRYISNHSSGKMGYALARAARERGADVTLISGPTHLPAPLDIRPVRVGSAAEMLEAVLDHFRGAHAVIGAAAVADYRMKIQNPCLPAGTAKSKIKKKDELFNLKLEPTADILKTVAERRGREKRTLVGFALETENRIENAKIKLSAKDLDLVVANTPSTFDADRIEYSILHRRGKIEHFPLQPKAQAAHTIIDRTANLF